jgi:hypothetical protein
MLSSSDWIGPLALLISLKLVAILLVSSLLKPFDGMSSYPATGNLSVGFIVLPLASVMVDHCVDIRVALNGNIGSVWMSIVQSIFRTYFFIRPLAAFTGHEIDPSGGRICYSVCLVATASCLSLPGVPCMSSFRLHTRVAVANLE